MKVHHVDRPLGGEAGAAALGPTVDVCEAEATAERALAAGRAERAEARAARHGQRAGRQSLQLRFQASHGAQYIAELLQKQLLLLVESDSVRYRTVRHF